MTILCLQQVVDTIAAEIIDDVDIITSHHHCVFGVQDVIDAIGTYLHSDIEISLYWRQDMLNEIEDENLYRALLTVDKRTLQIVLLKMQGYSPKEIAPIVDLSVGLSMQD